MVLPETEFSKKHQLQFEVLAGADLSPIDIDRQDDEGVETIFLMGIHWLNDGQIEFGLRDVAPGYWPVVSNRPNNNGQRLNGEVMVYDHESLPKRGRLEYNLITPDGILEVLRDNEPCTLRVRYIRQIGIFALSEERGTNCSMSEELEKAA